MIDASISASASRTAGLARQAAPSVSVARRHRGARAELSGRAAEEAVERRYAVMGLPVVARRWRGNSGEIDLILSEGEGLVFVEVKSARSWARAAERVTRRQMLRIMGAASEYLAGMPLGALTPIRFDLAMVDGAGRVDILQNAFLD